MSSTLLVCLPARDVPLVYTQIIYEGWKGNETNSSWITDWWMKCKCAADCANIDWSAISRPVDVFDTLTWTRPPLIMLRNENIFCLRIIYSEHHIPHICLTWLSKWIFGKNLQAYFNGISHSGPSETLGCLFLYIFFFCSEGDISVWKPTSVLVSISADSRDLIHE